MTPLNLHEAYQSVYDDSLRDDLITLDEELNILSELYDDELDEVIEDTFINLVNEGYNIDDVEYIFEDILNEAKVTMGRGGESTSGSKRVTTGSGSRMVASTRLSARRAAKRRQAIERVQGAVQRASDTVRGEVQRGAREVRGRVEGAKRDIHRPLAGLVGKYGLQGEILSKAGKPIRSATNIQPLSPEHRSQIRSAIMRNLGTIAKGELGAAKQYGQQQVGRAASAVGGFAKRQASRAASAVGGFTQRQAGRATSAGRAVGGFIQQQASRAKGAVKSGVRGALRGVARGALGLASKLKEDAELYDAFLTYLIDEGYADCLGSAEIIVENMSDDWIESVLTEGVFGARYSSFR